MEHEGRCESMQRGFPLGSSPTSGTRWNSSSSAPRAAVAPPHAAPSGMWRPTHARSIGTALLDPASLAVSRTLGRRELRAMLPDRATPPLRLSPLKRARTLPLPPPRPPARARHQPVNSQSLSEPPSARRRRRSALWTTGSWSNPSNEQKHVIGHEARVLVMGNVRHRRVTRS